MNRELQHQDNIKRFLAEGRTVSGGDGNGPGKPGYRFLILTGNSDSDTDTLNALADEGYRFEAAITPEGNGLNAYILLANYKKD